MLSLESEIEPEHHDRCRTELCARVDVGAELHEHLDRIGRAGDGSVVQRPIALVVLGLEIGSTLD